MDFSKWPTRGPGAAISIPGNGKTRKGSIRNPITGNSGRFSAQILPRYFNGHQRVAMSLTGGLDTRMVMAWHKPQPGSLPCYTFGGMLRDCQDVVVAREVARVCEQPHQVIGVGKEFLSRFPHYAERAVYLTDGCVSVGLTPDLYLHEKARQIAPVRMTGLYGGEILRGARAFRPEEPSPGLFSPEFLRYIRHAKETYRDAVQGHPVSFAAFRQAPWYHYGILALEETQLSVRTPFLDNDLVRTVLRAPQSALGSNGVSLRLIADGNPALARIPTDRGVGGNRGRFAEAVSHGLSISSSRPNTPSTWECPSGSPGLTTPSRPSASNAASSGDTRSSILGLGTAMLSLGTLRRCCSTPAAFPGYISIGKA